MKPAATSRSQENPMFRPLHRRAALLLAAIGWCLWLSWRVCAGLPAARKAGLWLSMVLACSLPAYGWWLQFWGW